MRATNGRHSTSNGLPYTRLLAAFMLATLISTLFALPALAAEPLTVVTTPVATVAAGTSFDYVTTITNPNAGAVNQVVFADTIDRRHDHCHLGPRIDLRRQHAYDGILSPVRFPGRDNPRVRHRHSHRHCTECGCWADQQHCECYDFHSLDLYRWREHGSHAGRRPHDREEPLRRGNTRVGRDLHLAGQQRRTRSCGGRRRDRLTQHRTHLQVFGLRMHGGRSTGRFLHDGQRDSRRR